jgi:transketolase
METHTLDTRAIDTIRTFTADVVQKAKSGHPGAPMGMSAMAHVLFTKFLRFNPKNPEWFNRDRFVLSNGHSSALLYTMLHMTGYEQWTMEVLKTFRQLESIAAGHPENHFDGIEVTTGPLGQGIANAVGIAMGEAHLAAQYNKEGFSIVDNYTYVFCGDGCLQEGISSEASSLAGHLGLGRLIMLYDDNQITIDGGTELSFSEDVLKRYESYGWHVQHVTHGNTDIEGLQKAIQNAKDETSRPSIIKVTTIIGWGSTKQGTHGVHGSPLGDEEIVNLKKKLGFDSTQFFQIPDEVRALYDRTEKGKKDENEWNKLVADYVKKYPDSDLQRRISGKLPEGWDKDLPTYSTSDQPAATRVTSGKILNHFAKKIPELFGGSADLNPSCFTYLNDDKDFQKGTYNQRNIRFGVREHAMAAICNGLSAYGGIIPFCSTFLNFIGYAYGAVILSGLSREGILYIFTHDSVFLAEDGPTHQPIEKFMTCRATPNLHFFRPADSNETLACYIHAIRTRNAPTVMSLSRQNLPVLKGSSVENALKGGYIVHAAEKPQIILVSTGSEVAPCVEAASKNGNFTVVSLPCWELFEEQSAEYKKSIFPEGIPVLSVEAGATLGWERYAHVSHGIDTYGTSANGNDIAKHFKLLPKDIEEIAQKVIVWGKGKSFTSRLDKPF